MATADAAIGDAGGGAVPSEFVVVGSVAVRRRVLRRRDRRRAGRGCDGDGGPKPKMQAVDACMRKLVAVCYGVLKSRQPFDPKWTSRIAT